MNKVKTTILIGALIALLVIAFYLDGIRGLLWLLATDALALFFVWVVEE